MLTVDSVIYIKCFGKRRKTILQTSVACNFPETKTENLPEFLIIRQTQTNAMLRDMLSRNMIPAHTCTSFFCFVFLFISAAKVSFLF